jgi:hypothetical protein
MAATGAPSGLSGGSVEREDRSRDAALDLGHGNAEVERDPGIVPTIAPMPREDRAIGVRQRVERALHRAQHATGWRLIHQANSKR